MTDSKARKRIREEEQGDCFQPANGAQEGVNGTQINGDSLASQISQAKPSAAIENAPGQLPPEIEHITFGYLSMSNLVTRLVQETFNGLSECINDMSELPVPQNESEVTADTQKVNEQKKLRLLNFAQDRRAQFIKILVLSQWSRQAESISKVIDLRVWLESQRRLYDDACNWMGELKRIMESERMPNPDLKTALEALSLGKAPALPDLGYLPPQPLSPQQLLKALQGINTQLSIRLHLHETIPPAFRDHSIANGRVTFRVPNEFEVDLSIADDDPSKQLYFIDFRLSFSPTPAELPQGHLRGELEHRVNEVLSRDGLNGCYCFLHNFVLSHKLNILKHQAYRLSQEKWSEHLKVEAVHRSLVIQYWVSRPGGKNWVELGIRRRKAKRSSWLQQEEDDPHIGIRWFRSGKETTNVPVTFNLGDLSVETILKQVISAHTDSIFKETKAKLSESHLYSKNILRLKRTRSVAEPTKSRLCVQLTPSQSCTVIQEPVTGRLALQPASSLNSRAERELNSLVSPEKDASSRITQLRAIAAADEVENTARCHGWEIVSSIRPSQEILRQHFGNDTLKASFFRKRSWNAQWLLVFTASLAGDGWWIVELDDRTSKPAPTAALGPSVRAAFKVSANGAAAASKELSFLDLAKIERTAAGLISQFTDSRQLSIQDFPHKLVRPIPNKSHSELPTLYVHFPEQRAQKFQRSSKPSAIPWTSQTVRISFMGTDASKALASHLVVAQIGPATLRSQSLNSMIGEFIKFHPKSGAFAFRLTTPIGQSTIPAILDRLARVQRLVDYVTTLQAFKIKARNLSLDHLEFTYAGKPQDCRVKISFAGDEPPQLTLNQGNPHLRIQDQLTGLFRKANGLNQVILYLRLTLPLMRAFAAIEAAHANNEVTILPRSADWFHIRYDKPPARFDLRLRKRRENLMWFVQPLSLDADEKQDQRVRDELNSMIKGRGEGWIGVSPGIAATLDGVESVLKKIDDSFQHVPTTEPMSTGEKQDFKGQKRKAEDSDVVVLD
ncbi:MAG: hypothetical protein Q9225_001613 [Loekoesia sp. 1 TL-2023]